MKKLFLTFMTAGFAIYSMQGAIDAQVNECRNETTPITLSNGITVPKERFHKVYSFVKDSFGDDAHCPDHRVDDISYLKEIITQDTGVTHFEWGKPRWDLVKKEFLYQLAQVEGDFVCDRVNHLMSNFNNVVEEEGYKYFCEDDVYEQLYGEQLDWEDFKWFAPSSFTREEFDFHKELRKYNIERDVPNGERNGHYQIKGYVDSETIGILHAIIDRKSPKSVPYLKELSELTGTIS